MWRTKTIVACEVEETAARCAHLTNVFLRAGLLGAQEVEHLPAATRYERRALPNKFRAARTDLQALAHACCLQLQRLRSTTGNEC